jgi:protein disulfide-isomerase A1
MKYCLVLLALFCVAFSAESDVVDLTADSFGSVIKDNEFVLVEFYAPWCGHCKSLAPEYEKAATELKEKGSKIVLAKVDCTKEESLARDHGIQGFPTLKFFRNGNAIPFEGERKAASIVNWVELKSGPAFKVLATAEEAEAHSTQKDVNVIAYLADGDDFTATLQQAAQQALFEDFAPFGIVNDADIAKGLGLEVGEVKLFKKAGESVTYKAADGDFEGWLSDNIFPLVDEIGQKSYSRAQESGNPIVLVFFNEADKESIIEMATEVATQFKRKAGFLYGLGSTFSRNLGAMGASGEKFPTALALNLKNTNKPIPFDEKTEFNKDSFVAFVEGVMAGTYEGNKKSEAIPAENNGPVTVVVGDNFNDIVMDSSKDVLLEFYAPWCGHCKSLAPIYEELATKLSSNDKMVIAKIDATANWYPSNVDVQGYPTILLFPAGDKTPVSFDGDRTVEGFEAWLKVKATTAFAGDAAGSAKEEL